MMAKGDSVWDLVDEGHILVALNVAEAKAILTGDTSSPSYTSGVEQVRLTLRDMKGIEL